LEFGVELTRNVLVSWINASVSDESLSLRASFHVSQAGKICTRRQVDPIDYLACLGEWRRKISRFTKIGGQTHWWRLVKLEGNQYVSHSYLISSTYRVHIH